MGPISAFEAAQKYHYDLNTSPTLATPLMFPRNTCNFIPPIAFLYSILGLQTVFTPY